MDSSKVQQILNWPQPRNIKALQSFLGFANFYHCFIKNYFKKITSLTSLLKKDYPFIFSYEALSQFQILKEAFTTAPILAHLNPSLPTIVENDASDYALGAVLSQVNDSGKHPIAFYSHKLLPAELNYEIYDKEPFGIVWALKSWRAFLLSLSNPFEVLTDHYSLQYFMSSKILTCNQGCWAEFLSEFHFTITYRPGRLATLPDALSRWDDMYPERVVDFISKNPQTFHQVIKQDGIQESRFFSIKVEIFSDLVDKIQKEVQQDKDDKEILKQLARGESIPDYSLEPQAKLLLFKDRVVVPSNEEIQLNILQKHHESPLAGHPVCQQLKISRDISTAFHPETDGQTERVNHILEQYLWMYVSYHQDDWHTWLPLAEFVYNNAEHSSTKQSPSFTIYGRNPSFDSIHVSQDSPAGELSTKLQSVQKTVKEELESAIRRFKKYADRNRAIPLDFQPGAKVWLASKNLKTTRPTKKLSDRWLDPFDVLKKIGSHAYHLKLPQQWKSVHPVFNVSLLEPVKQSTILNQH
ncbi:hypothetical protein O181_032672 [Austropuccinia psidii MF-1]|uniref:Integrase catalytic domain-containing protein n=1 Tax=Austropuccinia psidii MF-1 TaxID=1389203 RepID=A0A9Q3H6G4_9BASI|nr:hypothetical protein [Austropuccinia psidii MF-1]